MLDKKQVIEDLRWLEKKLKRPPRLVDLPDRTLEGLKYHFVGIKEAKEEAGIPTKFKHKCSICGKKYKSRTLRSKYCSKKCARKIYETSTRNRNKSLPLYDNDWHPSNVWEVIYLLGKVKLPEGIKIERINRSDAVCRKNKKKFKVKILLSSWDFKKYGHNQEKYKLLICWKDDWENCPLKVIELKDLVH